MVLVIITMMMMVVVVVVVMFHNEPDTNRTNRPYSCNPYYAIPSVSFRMFIICILIPHYMCLVCCCSSSSKLSNKSIGGGILSGRILVVAAE